MKTLKATYLLTTSDIKGALRALTRGQSVGNPSILTKYETKEFLTKWCAKGKWHETIERNLYTVLVEWPEANFGTEGINYLLSVLMGGQCDIDLIEGCRLMELDLGSQSRHWPGPKYGVSGLRKALSLSHRPFIGGIIKPKIGLDPLQLAEVVSQMIEGGCDIIKEDEILANQFWCPMERRLSLLEPMLEGRNILYLVCVTGDGSEVWKKARKVSEYGPQFGVHCNLWAGMGTYKDLREHCEMPIFFQKSGDRTWTTGPFSLDYSVLCQLLHYAGCDMAHVGMYGGYLTNTVAELKDRIGALQTTLPSFSCGMNPALARKCHDLFGNDILLMSGGWIHGQSDGIAQAVRRLKGAIHEQVSLK